MNSNDDQKPIIEETPPVSGPPMEPEQEEKYKQILDEYTKNLQPTDLNIQQPIHQVPTNQPEHDSSPQSEPDSFSQTENISQLDQSIQDTHTFDYNASKPSDYIPPSPQLSSTPSEPSHQLPPQYQPPTGISSQDESPSPLLTSSPPTPDDTSSTPNKSNFFKYLFILSTLVFIVIVILLAKDYIKLQQLTQNTPTVEPVVKTEPTIPSELDHQKCFINDAYLSIGQSFPAQDSCNSCQCQLVDDKPQVVCTTNDCDLFSQSTQSAVPSQSDYQDSL